MKENQGDNSKKNGVNVRPPVRARAVGKKGARIDRTYGYDLEERRVGAGARTPIRTDIAPGRGGRAVGVRRARTLREQGKGIGILIVILLLTPSIQQ